jgi:hypothetical protein
MALRAHDPCREFSSPVVPRGLGRAIARELARRGHHVIATARRVETRAAMNITW